MIRVFPRAPGLSKTAARLLTPCLALALGLPGSNAAEFKIGSHTFTLPDGFTIEAVAATPLVDRPVEMDFDEQGRLYVTDSSGSNAKVEKQLEERPHRIVRLEDSDGDGRFDKSVVFADKMMFPEGAMWMDGSLYVSAPPSIWRLTDTDGDGVADRRDEWFRGGTLTGCANDLHGPYRGLDGWIYWTKGAFAKQVHERPGRPPISTRAAHIFRARPDGSGLETVMTGGMDNPVGVTFTAGGERILTTTFFQHPEAGRRDGLIHAIYGGVYGKIHDVLDEHPKTGDYMPVLTHLGPAAPCGLTRYQSSVFGPEYRHNLFSTLFNLHKVTRHVLEPDGPTYRSRDLDFLVSDNPDFHPTDVLEDADGSLLVIDTGGWYKICCPTSQLWKPDILGAIYRIRRTEAIQWKDPRGLKLGWASMKPAELIRLLDDRRPAIQTRARTELAARGESAIEPVRRALRESESAETRLGCVWALAQIDSPAARDSAIAALSDRDETVRLAATHVASIWRHVAAVPALIVLLQDASPAVQRAAAEALGRIGDARAVPALLAAASASPPRVLEHSLIFALLEIGNAAAVREGLTAASAGTRRAALIALDQMPESPLQPEIVAPCLTSTDPVLKQTGSWIVSHRPAWGKALAQLLGERLALDDLAEPERIDLRQQLAALARDGDIQALLAATARNPSRPSHSRIDALQAMALAALKPTPTAWIEAVVQCLAGTDAAIVDAAVRTARTFAGVKDAATGLSPALTAVARDASRPDCLLLDALAAIPAFPDPLGPDLFTFLQAQLDPARPVGLRGTAAGVLARARLNAGQMNALADSIGSAGPLEVPRLLAAFSGTSDEALGLRLIASLRKSPALSSLHPDLVKPRLTNFPQTVQRQADELLASLNADAGRQQAHIDRLLGELKEGDVRRGQTIFNSTKAACASCHAIGYLGGKVGPDLTKIGQIRTERDLLEAIVYPSTSFVRSYEPITVSTRDGERHSGVLRKDAPDEVVLATGPDAEVRIARDEVVDMQPGSVSVMPQGLDEQISRQELADLMAFLKATRW